MCTTATEIPATMPPGVSFLASRENVTRPIVAVIWGAREYKEVDISMLTVE